MQIGGVIALVRLCGEDSTYAGAITESAARFGLERLWSVPIHLTFGHAVGTLELYSQEGRAPSERELQVIEGASRLAAKILDRGRQKIQASRGLRARKGISHRITLANFAFVN